MSIKLFIKIEKNGLCITDLFFTGKFNGVFNFGANQKVKNLSFGNFMILQDSGKNGSDKFILSYIYLLPRT